MNDWLDGAFALPTRDGQDVGGAQERTMLAFAQGATGIRTVEELNPDGTITTLRTRYGRPTFETTNARRATAAPTLIPRGFVAKVPSGRAVLFDPYTLEVLQSEYSPALNTYSVQEFASSWNRAPDTVMADVVLFEGTTIKVNAKAMPALGITANHNYPAVPYVIYRDTADDRYGNAERNLTEKRVFAVGRYRVTSWGGENSLTVILEPSSARPDKSLTLGQRVEPSVNTAFIEQLYFTGTWLGDFSSRWRFSSAEVQMMLEPPYLSVVSSDVSAEFPAGEWVLEGANIAGTELTSLELPPAELMLVGSPLYYYEENYSIPANGVGGSAGHHVVVWPWTHTHSDSLYGDIHSTYLRTRYAADAEATTTQGGATLTYNSSNYKNWDISDEYVVQRGTTVIISDETSTLNALGMSADSGTLWWGGITNPGYDPTTDISGYRGPCQKIIEQMTIPGTSVTARNNQRQAGQASVVMTKNGGEDYLITITFSKDFTFGEGYDIFAVTGRYNTYLLGTEDYAPGWFSLYNYPGYGLGGASRATLGPFVNTTIDQAPIYSWYKNPTGHDQDPSAILDINNKYKKAVSAFMGQILYDSEDSNGHVAVMYYYGTVVPSKTVRVTKLEFHTKDYIFFDDTNRVYISVESHCDSPSRFELRLSVFIVIDAPNVHLDVFVANYIFTFADILKEQEVYAPDELYAVPSPQLRAMFAPLYREQGSFKGIHYTTMSDQAAGASPYVGINFVLNLQMYADLPDCNVDNLNGQQVYFVPFNLIEALYLYIFSQESGISASSRYPVTRTDNYNLVRDTLFSDPIRVSVHNGEFYNWTDTFGPDFAAVGTVSLHRT